MTVDKTLEPAEAFALAAKRTSTSKHSMTGLTH